ncbi:hypothetical protein MHM87_03740 [Alteromonas sp. Cnat3-28]|uniref:hypothetical protein n=1 Tax=Alteromonas sp. Cnat3-28 TaxID=2917729 RepID=UPI001EF6EA02|nr:hypothetical protein [Alteromonas sp. Cnat3-28]MCG7644701.1 hypothetical protein [Alteromonas sp. Cnat3-28]
MKHNVLFDNLMYPVLLILFMIVLHCFAGTIQFPVESSDAQRDLNTAIGTSLLSGVFLLAIRVLQQKVANNLLLILNTIKKQNEFGLHRRILSEQFKKQVVWAISIGFMMPLLYMISEGVIERIDEKEVFIVAMSAIPFWLLLSLFIMQLTTVNRYLWKFLSDDTVDAMGKLKLYKYVISLTVTTIMTTSMVFLVIPVFWINQPIHLFDAIFISCLFAFFVVFLLTPLIYFHHQVKKIKLAEAKEIDKTIAQLIKQSLVEEKSKEIEHLLHVKETLCDPKSSWKL